MPALYIPTECDKKERGCCENACLGCNQKNSVDSQANLVRLQRGLALAISDLGGHDLLRVDHLVVAHYSGKTQMQFKKGNADINI